MAADVADLTTTRGDDMKTHEAGEHGGGTVEDTARAEEREEARDLVREERDETPPHPLVPVEDLPSAWRETAESCEASAERHDAGVDRAEWEAMAGQLRECAEDLEAHLAAHDDPQADADRKLGAAMRALWQEWEADADEETGEYDGSAADQCADVYAVLCANGCPVR